MAVPDFCTDDGAGHQFNSIMISLIESLTCNLDKTYKPNIKDRLTASVIMLSAQMKSHDF